MSLDAAHEELGPPDAPQPSPIIIAKRSLLVLCGPAGSGKSTFARTLIAAHQQDHLSATAIVSSDRCRAIVCDDEAMREFDASQQRHIQQHTFELFYAILAKRLALGRLSIADTVCLHEAVRMALLEIAHKFNAPTCLFVFAMTLQTCLEQNQHQHRTHRIPEDMIASKVQQLQLALPQIPHESWDHIRIFNEHHRDAQILITPS